MPNGLRWSVGLTRSTSGCYFDRDWNMFAYANRLTDDDVLVFAHFGGPDFNVMRFNANGRMPHSDIINIDYFASRPYHDSDGSSEDTGSEWEMPGAGSLSMIPSFTVVLLASDMERGLNLPSIWWKTNVADKDSVERVKLWVGESSWNVKVRIQSESVKMTSGWTKFVVDNELSVGTLCRFEMLPAPKTTFRVTFDH